MRSTTSCISLAAFWLTTVAVPAPVSAQYEKTEIKQVGTCPAADSLFGPPPNKYKTEVFRYHDEFSGISRYESDWELAFGTKDSDNFANQPTRVLAVWDEPLDDWRFFLQLRAKNTTWRFLDNHRLDFVVDGKRAFGRTHEQVLHDGDVVSGGDVVELMTTELTPAQMAQLASGKEVLGRLGNKEFKYRRQNQDQLPLVYRTIVCYLPEHGD